MWGPIVLACMVRAFLRCGVPPAATLLLTGCGVVLWEVLEYSIHRSGTSSASTTRSSWSSQHVMHAGLSACTCIACRFIFHARPASYWPITLHFGFHGCHHKFPLDKERLVFPPVPAILVASAIYALLAAVLPQVCPMKLPFNCMFKTRKALYSLGMTWHDDVVPCGQVAVFPVFTGVLLGYLTYDCIHYAIHHGALPKRSWLAAIKRAHLEHHSRRPDANFGISSPMVDILLQSCSES